MMLLWSLRQQHPNKMVHCCPNNILSLTALMAMSPQSMGWHSSLQSATHLVFAPPALLTAPFGLTHAVGFDVNAVG